MRRGSAGVAAADVAVLAAELSALRARVAGLESERDERLRRRLLPGDPAFLAKLLPAMSGCWGSETCLIRHVFEDPQLARLVAGRSAIALGKLFSRAAGVPVGPYVLVDCGEDSVEGVRRWRVDGA